MALNDKFIRDCDVWQEFVKQTGPNGGFVQGTGTKYKACLHCGLMYSRLFDEDHCVLISLYVCSKGDRAVYRLTSPRTWISLSCLQLIVDQLDIVGSIILKMKVLQMSGINVGDKVPNM